MKERLFLRLADDATCGPETTVPAGTLRVFPVSAPLQGHVSQILSYRETLPAGETLTERVLPDGAVRLVSAAQGRLSLRQAADAVNVGERRLQQLFFEHVGVSFRAWARLSRLHACLRLIRRQPAPAWADVAVDAGFYDQAHLANEFRALCGLSPTSFLQHGIAQSSKTGD
jgi:transcriptional regulator GlxA family with amidase domain